MKTTTLSAPAKGAQHQEEEAWNKRWKKKIEGSTS
jgi:hypothetical protein